VLVLMLLVRLVVAVLYFLGVQTFFQQDARERWPVTRDRFRDPLLRPRQLVRAHKPVDRC
jgi:hypothetical protein